MQHCKIVLGKGAKPEAALKPINAVLNSGGGIVQMKIDGFKPKDLKDVDTFWSKLQPKLDQMVQPSAYTDVFDQKRVGDTIFLFAQGSKPFLYSGLQFASARGCGSVASHLQQSC